MKKTVFDVLNWKCGYSYYHPVFYTSIKTNLTPAHLHEWPIRRLFTPVIEFKDPNLKYLKNSKCIHEKGNLDAYQKANKFNLDDPFVEPLSDAEKKIIFKRLARKNDLKSITLLISKYGIKSHEYYDLASGFFTEASSDELATLLENGLKSGIPPNVSLINKIFQKAYESKDFRTCKKLWSYLPFLERDSRLEQIVLTKLELLRYKEELLPVYKYAKEWQVLTPRVKERMWEVAKKIVKQKLILKDWEYVLRNSKLKRKN